MRWALKLGLYGIGVTGFMVMATVALPAIWVADAVAGIYRRLEL